jgi:hypothetical protein
LFSWLKLTSLSQCDSVKTIVMPQEKFIIDFACAKTDPFNQPQFLCKLKKVWPVCKQFLICRAPMSQTDDFDSFVSGH